MNDMEMLTDLARETPLSGPAGLAPARARLAAAIAAERGTERTGRPVTPSGGSRRRQLALVAAAALLAVGAPAATVIVNGTPARDSSGSPIVGGHGQDAFGPATTPAGVLRNAELAALQMPADPPKPGQFVYSKVIITTLSGGKVFKHVEQEWRSVDGTKVGLSKVNSYGKRPRVSAPPRACVNGYQTPPNPQPPQGKTRSCTPELFAAYLPAMPDTPGALRAYLARVYQDRPALPSITAGMMLHDYLLPKQRAAIYEMLAHTPSLGLTLVPRVATLQGTVGIGVRGGAGDEYSTLIFDPKTYALLSINTTGPDTTQGLVQAAFGIVDNPGQLP